MSIHTTTSTVKNSRTVASSFSELEKYPPSTSNGRDTDTLDIPHGLDDGKSDGMSEMEMMDALRDPSIMAESTAPPPNHPFGEIPDGGMIYSLCLRDLDVN